VRRPARNAQTPEPHSPYRLQACSQIWFDPILQDFARSLASVALRYRVRLDAFEQSADVVTATVSDLETGTRERIEAQYLVACDGANSMIRRELGIGLSGQGLLGHPVHMFFRARDLLATCGKSPATFFHPIGPEGLWGNIRVIDPVNGMWRIMVDNLGEVADPDDVDCNGILERALGRAYPVEWLGVSIWKRRSVVADSYGRGRVFLAGDAVHQLSPTGALGMNTGIGDAVDLGWKLAAVLHGWGGDALLDSYDSERRPVGHRNVAMAAGFYLNNEAFGRGCAALEDDSAAGAEARRTLGAALERDVGREFRTIGLQLGYRYEDSPICVADGTPAPPDDPERYFPTARPGSRAPHVWLGNGRSTLDHYGRGFALLRFAGSPPSDDIGRAAAGCGVPLTVVDVEAPEAAALYERRLVLVRPDGHVAWRADAVPPDVPALIDRVRGAG
jgi:2-polyprenyl-6-methoxyphenol hydroxylase-like FAD-dependent oxidoreductase